jgi:SAM-dependent methyltransferase
LAVHPSAYRAVAALVENYVPKEGALTVVEIGSRTRREHMLHRNLFDLTRCEYIGVDLTQGQNVDLVLERPYGLPFDSDTIDVIVCGQVFEHIPFFWVTMIDFSRVLRRGGLVILSAPSRGHVHHLPFDGWRFYAHGYKALAQFSGLECVVARTDHPRLDPETRRFDYTQVNGYWGDTVGVFRKGDAYDEDAISTVRRELVAWANACAGYPEPSPTQQVTGARARVRHVWARLSRASA